MTNDTKGDALTVPDFTPVREYVDAQLADHAVAIAMNKAWKLEVQALRTRLAEAEWLLRWAMWRQPDTIHDYQGVGPTPEQHSAYVARARAFLATAPTPEASAGGANPSNQTE